MPWGGTAAGPTSVAPLDATTNPAMSPRVPMLAVFGKEVLDSLRERKALATAFLFGPLMGPVGFALMVNFAVSQQLEEAFEPVAVPVVGSERAKNLMTHLHSRMIDVDTDSYGDLDALRQAVQQGEVDVGLVVAEDYAEALRSGAPARVWVVADGGNTSTRVSATRLRSALLEYGGAVGAHRLLLRGVDPAVANPLAVLTDDVSTPSGRALILLGMITYFLMFATLLGGLQVAIDTTAGERERGTLEPLLTLPISRLNLVLGKVAAAALFMAASVAIAIVAFAIVSRFLPLAELGMDANLSPAVAARMYLVMLPVAVFGAGTLSLLASYTKSFREAQTYTGVAMLVPSLPILVAYFMQAQPSLPLMLVPGLSQHVLLTELIKGEGLDFANALVSAIATTAIGVAGTLATVRRYRSEKLLI